jgi:hypothetical protein
VTSGLQLTTGRNADAGQTFFRHSDIYACFFKPQITRILLSAAVYGYTVKKLRSINLLFSGMFHIERNIVTVGAEKFITLY